MPEPEEQLYHQAADAMVGAQGYKMTARTRQVLAAGWWRKNGFRAAVKVAYQAGYDAGRDYEAKGEWR